MAPGPGDELEAAGRGHLRASHADREQVIGTLKAAYVKGQLDKDELDLRVGRAFASRTYADLATLTADLPARLAETQPRKPARPQGGQPVPRPGRSIAVATAVYAGIWAYILFLSPNGGDNPSFPPLIVGGGFAYLIALCLSLMTMADVRREKRSGGQLPRRPARGAGGQASPDLPSADPGEQVAPVDDDHRHTAEAAQNPHLLPPLPGSRSPRRWHPAGRSPHRPAITHPA
jgi:hypothetical protein